MELERGVCVWCRNGKLVVLSQQTTDAWKIIVSLLPENILNITEFEKIQSFSSWKFCPPCYHKLKLLEGTNNKIKVNNCTNETSSCNCFLCNRVEDLYQVKKWQGLKDIMAILHSNETRDNLNTYIACRECFFYMTNLQEIKSILFSKYRKIKIRSPKSESQDQPENEIKTKTLASEISTHSTRRIRKKSRTSLYESSSSFIDLTSDNGGLPNTINFEPLKKFKALRHNKFFTTKIEDPKLLYQVPFVLLSTDFGTTSGRSSTSSKGLSKHSNDKKIVDINSENNSPNSKKKTSFFKIKLKRKKSKQLNPKSINIKKELRKHNFTKYLVINLIRHKLPLKQKFALMMSSDTELEENRVTPTKASRKAMPDSSVSSLNESEIIEKLSDSTSKRKSVSFAEDKNEYYNNDSLTNSSRNSSLDRSVSNIVSRILEKDEDITDGDKVNILSSDEEEDEHNEEFCSKSEEIGSDDVGNCENFDTPKKHKTVRRTSLFEESNEQNDEDTLADTLSEDREAKQMDIDVDEQVAGNTDESNFTSSLLEENNKEFSTESENTKIGDDNIDLPNEDADQSEQKNDTKRKENIKKRKYKAKPLSKKIKDKEDTNAGLNKAEETLELDSTDEEENKKKSTPGSVKIAKKTKPKPLSKKKRDKDIGENTIDFNDKGVNNEDNGNGNSPGTLKKEKKAKYKPKPLSKIKKDKDIKLSKETTNFGDEDVGSDISERETNEESEDSMTKSKYKPMSPSNEKEETDLDNIKPDNKGDNANGLCKEGVVDASDDDASEENAVDQKDKPLSKKNKITNLQDIEKKSEQIQEAEENSSAITNLSNDYQETEEYKSDGEGEIEIYDKNNEFRDRKQSEIESVATDLKEREDIINVSVSLGPDETIKQGSKSLQNENQTEKNDIEENTLNESESYSTENKKEDEISENDENNVDLVLTDMLTVDEIDDELKDDTMTFKLDSSDTEDGTNPNPKRKICESDELKDSSEKKKKKVTFSDF